MTDDLIPVILNRGYTSFAKATYSGGYVPPVFTGGTSVVIDALSVSYKYRNSAINISRPQSKSNQTGTAVSGTATISGNTLTDAGKFGSTNQYKNYLVNIATASPQDYIVMSNTVDALTLNGPPGDGAGIAYTVVKGAPINYIVETRRVTETLTVDGFLMNDHIYHTGYASKKYVEEKFEYLMSIIGAKGNVSEGVSVAWRDQVRFLKTLIPQDVEIVDDSKSEYVKLSASDHYTQRLGKLRVKMTLLWGTFK